MGFWEGVKSVVVGIFTVIFGLFICCYECVKLDVERDLAQERFWIERTKYN